MRKALYIAGGLVAVLIVLNLIGQSVDQQVAEQRHYEKISKATDGIQKFTGQKQ